LSAFDWTFGIKTMHVIKTMPLRFRVTGTRRDRFQYNLPNLSQSAASSSLHPIEETPDSVLQALKPNMPPRKSLDTLKAATGDEGTPAKEGSVREGVNIEVCDRS
jgi:hypothetical protein